jgi:hypothetical protein
MKIKGTKSVIFGYTESGTISLEQFDETIGEPVWIYLTIDQFRIIQKWLKVAEPNIQSAWNGGVENETNS